MAELLAPTPPEWVDAVTRFERDLTAQRLSSRTISVRVYHVKRMALAMPIRPDRLTRELVMDYLAKPNWKAVDTYNTVRMSLKVFLIWAWERRVISSDLADLLPPARRRLGTVSRPARQADIEQALEVASPAMRLMILLSADAGVKPAEIAHLHTRQLERQNDGSYKLVTQQSSGRRRELILRPDIAEAVLATGDGYVFPGKKDGHISPAYVSRLISKALPAGVSAAQLGRAFHESKFRLAWRDLASYHSAQSMRISEHPDFKDGQAVAQHLARIESALLNDDPAAAIGSCKELVETVFKRVLTAEGVELDPRRPLNFPQLWAKVREALSADTPADELVAESVGTVLESLTGVVEGIGRIRNKLGTGHGSDNSAEAEQRHARLVFNATVTVVEYVADTWRGTSAQA